jgi:hypothetical protein
VQRKEDKRKFVDTIDSKKMTASVTNQIIPKHSLETLATINKLKYFGHIMHISDSVKKDLILGLTDGSGN